MIPTHLGIAPRWLAELLCFRIPKDGGVIPTWPPSSPPTAGGTHMFQNPEGWGCDSHSADCPTTAEVQKIVSESRRMGV